MQAVVFAGADQPAQLREVARPTPGPGEVGIAVAACGLCGTDLHFWRGGLPPTRVPVTIGHEVAGTVTAVGPGVQRPALGDRVAVNPVMPCGDCRICRRGDTNLCSHAAILGLGVDGGFAEEVVVPASATIAVPDGVPLDVAAVAVEAGATVQHALVRRGQVGRDDRVLVLGVGGLGTVALLLLDALDVREVWAVDPDPAARDRAERMGARVLEPDATTRTVRAAMDGGADLVLDLVGTTASVERALAVSDRGGRTVVVGVTQQPLQFGRSSRLSVGGRSLVGSCASVPSDVRTVLELVAAGRLPLERVITDRVALGDVPGRIANGAPEGSVRTVAYPATPVAQLDTRTIT